MQLRQYYSTISRYLHAIWFWRRVTARSIRRARGVCAVFNGRRFPSTTHSPARGFVADAIRKKRFKFDRRGRPWLTVNRYTAQFPGKFSAPALLTGRAIINHTVDVTAFHPTCNHRGIKYNAISAGFPGTRQVRENNINRSPIFAIVQHWLYNMPIGMERS